LAGLLVVDTNIYIRAFREELFGQRFRAWHRANIHRLTLSTVVLYELMVGADTKSVRHRLEADYVRAFRHVNRILTPSEIVWEKAAEAEAELRSRKRYASKIGTRGFANDLLIALTCRTIGATLITGNVADFELIRSVTGVRFASELV
jgi:predicted nucleic acid-binding protein